MFGRYFSQQKVSLKKTRVVVAGAILLGFAFGWWLTPSLKDIRRIALGSDRILLDRNGQLLQTLRTDFSKRRLAWTPLNSFPESLRTDVILSEDQRFHSHLGFDVFGIGRAILAISKGQAVQGASTITMQLTDLIQDDVLIKHRRIQKGSLLHKLTQLVRAVFLELKWSKEEILEAYLNLIHLRGEFQGVPALSQAFLQKHPLALDRSETTVIAAMISSPNRGAKGLKQQACRLALRQDPGAAPCEEIEKAVDSFFARSPKMPASPGVAAHLARRLFREETSESILTATIDLNLQLKVMSILEKNLLKSANVNDSAAIVIDNKTGQVLAYVGAVGSSSSPHVDGVMASRQAGSTLKPFLYAKAFESKTLTPASILLDDPTAISWEGGVYRPANYNRLFYGAVSAREALASSLNVPAVKTVTILGLHQSYQVLQSIKLSGLKEPDFYGVSLALGAVEVQLQDLANAYRIFANRGDWSPLTYLKETSATSKIPAERVFSPETSYLLSSILSDPNARTIGFGWNTPLETEYWTAVKTGTSKDYRDNWCVGFSDRYTVGVWAGNFDASAMHEVSGVSGAGPSWFEIMNELHRSERSEPPARPEGVVMKKIRHAWASSEHEEFFIKGTEPSSNVIEEAPDKSVQFIFPADGSVLVKDPHMDQDRVALYVRFKGSVPANSRLFWGKEDLGEAKSPFKIMQPSIGLHEMSVRNAEGKILSSVRFSIRGFKTN